MAFVRHAERGKGEEVSRARLSVVAPRSARAKRESAKRESANRLENAKRSRDATKRNTSVDARPCGRKSLVEMCVAHRRLGRDIAQRRVIVIPRARAGRASRVSGAWGDEVVATSSAKRSRGIRISRDPHAPVVASRRGFVSASGAARATAQRVRGRAAARDGRGAMRAMPRAGAKANAPSARVDDIAEARGGSGARETARNTSSRENRNASSSRRSRRDLHRAQSAPRTRARPDARGEDPGVGVETLSGRWRR